MNEEHPDPFVRPSRPEANPPPPPDFASGRAVSQAEAARPARPVEEPLTGPLDMRKLFDALLKSPGALVARLGEPGHGATGRCAAIAIVSMIVYGVVLGCFASGDQLWAAPLKITAGLAISSAICFPSLYIFCALSGARLAAGQLAAVMAAMLALNGVLLLGFAPAVWVFTQATNSYGFMGALALGPWFVALIFGWRFLFSAAKATGATGTGPIGLWAAIFLVVTLQMTTSLRPILGHSDKFLTGEKKFFLEHWSDTAGEYLGAPVPQPEP